MIGGLIRMAIVAVFYVALWDRITPGIVISAILIAAVLQSPLRRRNYHVHPVGLVRAVGLVAVEVVRSNITVIARVLGIGGGHRQGVAEVELHRAPPGVDVLVGLVVTLTPGTMTLALDRQDDGSALLTVHAISMPSAQGIRDAVLRFEDAMVSAVTVAVDPATEEAI